VADIWSELPGASSRRQIQNQGRLLRTTPALCSSQAQRNADVFAAAINVPPVLNERVKGADAVCRPPCHPKKPDKRSTLPDQAYG